MVIFDDIPHVVRYGKAPKEGQPDTRPYRYRKVVPADVQEKIRRKNWFKTWKHGTDIAVVKHAAAILALRHDNEIAIARGEQAETMRRGQILDAETAAKEWLAGDPAELARFMSLLAVTDFGGPTPEQEAVRAAITGGGKHPGDSPLLSAAMEADIAAGRGAKDANRLREAVKTFTNIAGDLPITEYRRAAVTAWLDAEKQRVKPGTVKRHYGALKAMVGRTLVEMEFEGFDPFLKHVVKVGNGQSKRLPFSTAHLSLIDSHLASLPGCDREIRNIMNLLRNTAGRLSEIAGLRVADVILPDDGGIPFIFIREDGSKDLKSEAATRRVPLVGIALEAATDAVKHARNRDDGNPDKVQLFSCFDGSESARKDLSVTLCRVIRTAGVPKSKRLTCHSLRHTVIESLKHTDTPDRIIKRLVGHAAQSVTENYGASDVKLEVLQKALTAALEVLGDCDNSIFTDDEKVK